MWVLQGCAWPRWCRQAHLVLHLSLAASLDGLDELADTAAVGLFLAQLTIDNKESISSSVSKDPKSFHSLLLTSIDCRVTAADQNLLN